MSSWKILSRTTVLKYEKYLTVENHVIELPDGRIISDWPWIISPDYINILAITQGEQFLCFRQTKYAYEGTSLGVVGGYLEPDEEPLEAAQRELLEETGYQASQWISLGHYAVDGNRGAGIAHPFLALGAYPVSEPNADDLEELQLIKLSRPEIEEALATGQFKVLAWAAVVALALRYLDSRS